MADYVPSSTFAPEKTTAPFATDPQGAHKSSHHTSPDASAQVHATSAADTTATPAVHAPVEQSYGTTAATTQESPPGHTPSAPTTTTTTTHTQPAAAADVPPDTIDPVSSTKPAHTTHPTPGDHHGTGAGSARHDYEVPHTLAEGSKRKNSLSGVVEKIKDHLPGHKKEEPTTSGDGGHVSRNVQGTNML